MSTLLLLCAVALAGMAVAILWHEHGSRVGWVHFALSFALALWQGGLAMGITAADAQDALAVFRSVAVPAVVIAAALLYQLMHALTVRRGRFGLTVWAVWAVTAALLGMLFLSDVFVAGLHEYAWGRAPAYGWVGWVYCGVVLTVFPASAAFCWRTYRSSPRGSIAARRVRLLLIALTIAVGGLLDFLATFGLDVPMVGGVFLTVANWVNVLATWRYRLVEPRGATGWWRSRRRLRRSSSWTRYRTG